MFKIDRISFVLIALSLANILELFLPRFDEVNSSLRLPIQAINLVILMVMIFFLLKEKIHWNSVTAQVVSFISMIIFYVIYYSVFNSKRFGFSDIGDYIKWTLWLVSIVFFYEALLKNGFKSLFFKIYIITFIVAVAKKILEASIFDSEKLGGGDTASLPLLFILPIVLIAFSGEFRIVIIGLICVLILYSLRRTSIISLLVCLPFVFRYIRTSLKPIHFYAFFLLFSAAMYFTFDRLGEALIYRFEEMFVGSDKGDYGSGRSEFYKIVYDNWLQGDLGLLFGNGINSVKTLLMREYGITHAHNDYLEIGYTFGFFGLLLWIGIIITLFSLRKRFVYDPMTLNLLYIVVISYLVISLASGCVLRVTTVPFGLSIALLLYRSYVVTKTIRY